LLQLVPEDNPLDEEVLFVAKAKKLSNWDIKQDRIIVLSTHHLFLLSTGHQVSK
jgi:hypothetical protein